MSCSNLCTEVLRPACTSWVVEKPFRPKPLENYGKLLTKLPCALPAFGQPALKYTTDPKAVAGPKGPGAQRVLSCWRSAFKWASLCHRLKATCCHLSQNQHALAFPCHQAISTPVRRGTFVSYGFNPCRMLLAVLQPECFAPCVAHWRFCLLAGVA